MVSILLYHRVTYSQKEKFPKSHDPNGLIDKNPGRNANSLSCVSRMQLYWAIHHLALTKIFGFQLFFLVLSLPIFSLFTAAPNRPCGAYWSRSKLNTTQHQLVFSDRFLGCQLLSGPRNSFPETIKTCILHIGHPSFSHLSTICCFSLKLFPKQDQMNIWGKDIQTVNLWLWNDMNSFPAGEYFRQNVSIL